MTSLQTALNLLAYGVFILAPAMAWASRFNVAWTTNVALFTTAYLIPLILFDFNLLSDEGTLSTLTLLNTIGAMAMILGVIAGRNISNRKATVFDLYPDLNFIAKDPIAEKRASKLLIIGIIGMILCFAWMEMVPAFAEDPFSAKFFKGSYKQKYDQISIIYRFSQFSIITTLPLTMAYALERRRTMTVAASVLAMSVLAASLTRAPVLEGAMLIAAIMLSESKKKFIFFIIFSMIVYFIGGSVYAIIGLTKSEGSIFQDIAAGVPDIIDHLSFLKSFDIRSNLTYGMTFIGGLIPGNHAYNPAIFSLTISNPMADTSEIASGGFRMPPSLWGYASFGYIGSVLVCFISGLIIGRSKKLIRTIKTTETLSEKMAIVLWFKIIIIFYATFYAMFYFGLLSIIIFIYLTHKRPILDLINLKNKRINFSL